MQEMWLSNRHFARHRPTNLYSNSFFERSSLSLMPRTPTTSYVVLPASDGRNKPLFSSKAFARHNRQKSLLNPPASKPDSPSNFKNQLMRHALGANLAKAFPAPPM